MTSLLEVEVKTSKKTQNDSESLMVTQVDQTWNSLVEGLERIDTAVEELLNEEDR